MMGWSFLESPAITSSLECHPGCGNMPGRPSNAHGSGFAGPSGGAPWGQERKRLGGSFPALDVAFELGKGRALSRIQHLAAELHCHLRRVALHAREQRRLDALQLLAALVVLLLQQATERLDDAVREQDAEEGADQRRAD